MEKKKRYDLINCFLYGVQKVHGQIITATTGPVTTTYEKKKRGRPGARPRGEARIPNILRCCRHGQATTRGNEAYTVDFELET